MKIALIGRFEEGEILAGPARVGRELFFELKKIKPDIVFIEYFFNDYKNSSLTKKLFGKEIVTDNSVIRLGIIPLLLFFLKEKFDIIHIINHQRFILAIFLLKLFIKSRIAATLHGFLEYEMPRKNFWKRRYFIDLWLEKLIVYRSHILIFPSQLLSEIFVNRYNISEKKFKIIPNGVSEIFHTHKRDFPPIEKSLKIIFYNGFDFNIKKGLAELISLIKNYKGKIELFVMGQEGNVGSTHNIKIIYSGIKPHTELINFLIDKHFVIKSPAFEPFSIFVAECMSFGVIPIINQNVGAKNFVVDRLNGFVYKNSSTNDLKNLLDEIIGGHYDLEIISDNSKRIYELLNWKKIAHSYYESFGGLIF